MYRLTVKLLCAILTVVILGAARPVVAVETVPFCAAEDTAARFGDEGAYQVWMGTGTGSHVGDYVTLTYVKVKGYSGQAEGTTQMTTADGSVLYIEHETTWNYDTRCWEGEFWIVGGEGRFEGATGSGDIFVCAPEYLEVLIGVISY